MQYRADFWGRRHPWRRYYGFNMYIKKQNITHKNKIIKKKLFFYTLGFILLFLQISFIMLHDPLTSRLGRGGGMYFYPPFTFSQYLNYLPIVIIVSLLPSLSIFFYYYYIYGKIYLYNNFIEGICEKCNKKPNNKVLENSKCDCGGIYSNVNNFTLAGNENPYSNFKYSNFKLLNHLLVLPNNKIIKNPKLKEIIYYFNHFEQLDENTFIIKKNNNNFIKISKTLDDWKYYIEYYIGNKIYYESSKNYPFDKTIDLIHIYYEDLNNFMDNINWTLITYS
jgi:hypothetical protein